MKSKWCKMRFRKIVFLTKQGTILESIKYMFALSAENRRMRVNVITAMTDMNRRWKSSTNKNEGVIE